jgi:putative membrane protein
MEKASGDKGLIWVVAVAATAVPVLVALLFFVPAKLELGDFVKTLPHFHAALNSLTSLLLVFAFIAIKLHQVKVHKLLMISCFVMGILFLISYVMYHASVSPVMFGDLNHDGKVNDAEKALAPDRNLYLFVLLSHILLSVAAVPLVLLALYRGLKNQVAQHKRIVRFAYPIWLYVSVTGVIVYFMIRPYYF